MAGRWPVTEREFHSYDKRPASTVAAEKSRAKTRQQGFASASGWVWTKRSGWLDFGCENADFPSRGRTGTWGLGLELQDVEGGQNPVGHHLQRAKRFRVEQ